MFYMLWQECHQYNVMLLVHIVSHWLATRKGFTANRKPQLKHKIKHFRWSKISSLQHLVGIGTLHPSWPSILLHKTNAESVHLCIPVDPLPTATNLSLCGLSYKTTPVLLFFFLLLWWFSIFLVVFIIFTMSYYIRQSLCFFFFLDKNAT